MTQVSEETPLLTNDHALIYERFSPRKKKVLVAIASWGELVAFLSAGIFVPSIPRIAKDLNSTGEVINYAISIYILSSSFGGLMGSKYAKFYGRRFSYTCCLPVMIVGSLGVARAQTVTQLIVWRSIQGVGASPSMSVGAGVIGDIYKLEERGTALGSYIGTGLFGLALAPLFGGAIAHYWSWRALHYFLAIFAFGALLCILLFFPETIHPGTKGLDGYERSGKVHPKWRPVILNPLSQLWYLRSPNILAVAIMSYLILLSSFTLLVPIPYTIAKRYHIENEALIGLCFLPDGIGGAIGAPLAGWASDKIVIRYKRQRGKWYPEDRLRASFFGSFLPITVIASALVTSYVPGLLGLVLNLALLLCMGISIDLALTPCSAYLVDVLQSNSAEVTAAVEAFRSIALSISTAVTLPMINTHGLVFTNLVVSLLGLSGLGLTWLTITYGESMRSWVDVGYSTADND
ncbi:MFS general substrate transporter [Macrolepiota fuliginosa MF-IS2]|uniref:MFS general substrate transporter n=1 Tax=Macrolepiota fuliginosa MF-IS2 TaxID=1400762 RepID=A0A9P6BZ67_9AGAR|nr:MFS general substrate transporter [Macrolepiota fuliginosa MF-IS2]